MRSSYATTIRDLGTALGLSLLVTPRKSPVIEAIDEAIRECRLGRSSSYSPDRFNDHCEALDKLYEARRLVAGERA